MKHIVFKVMKSEIKKTKYGNNFIKFELIPHSNLVYNYALFNSLNQTMRGEIV